MAWKRSGVRIPLAPPRGHRPVFRSGDWPFRCRGAKGVLGERDELPAHVRELQIAVGTDEEPPPERALQAPDLFREAGLGDVLVECRRREGPVLDGGEEVLELPQAGPTRHAASVSRTSLGQVVMNVARMGARTSSGTTWAWPGITSWRASGMVSARCWPVAIIQSGLAPPLITRVGTATFAASSAGSMPPVVRSPITSES